MCKCCEQKFDLGKTVATPGAIAAMEKAKENPGKFLSRHASGDWGEMCDEDKKLNDESVTGGDRLMSAYLLADGTKVWVITEWDRSVTTILLPDEY